MIHNVNLNKAFELFCDASGFVFGGVLTLENKIVGMYNSKLNNAEKNYTTTEKEGSAVIKTLKFFKPIVFGSEIIVYSDYLNLSFIQKSTSPKIRLRSSIGSSSSSSS